MTEIEKRKIECALGQLIRLLKEQPMGVAADCITWIVDAKAKGDESIRDILISVVKHSVSGPKGILFADILTSDTCFGVIDDHD